MKKLLLLILLSLATPVLALEPDKIAHYGSSAVYGLVTGTVIYGVAKEMGPVGRFSTSAGLAFIPGLAVEIGDEFSPHNHFDWSDLLADGLGAVSGAVAAELINGQLWISASGKQIRLIGKW